MLARPDFLLHDYLDLFDGMTFVDYDDYYDNGALTMAAWIESYGREMMETPQNEQTQYKLSIFWI